MNSGDVVQAEVLLRTPGSSASETVAGLLRQKGVEVTSTGAASLSIRCPREVFEAVFGTRLGRERSAEVDEGVHDYGSLGYEAGVPEEPIRIPEDLGAEVAGVYVQQPPRLL